MDGSHLKDVTNEDTSEGRRGSIKYMYDNRSDGDILADESKTQYDIVQIKNQGNNIIQTYHRNDITFHIFISVTWFLTCSMLVIATVRTKKKTINDLSTDNNFGNAASTQL